MKLHKIDNFTPLKTNLNKKKSRIEKNCTGSTVYQIAYDKERTINSETHTLYSTVFNLFEIVQCDIPFVQLRISVLKHEFSEHMLRRLSDKFSTYSTEMKTALKDTIEFSF